jgi:hypothetical protein
MLDEMDQELKGLDSLVFPVIPVGEDDPRTLDLGDYAISL